MDRLGRKFFLVTGTVSAGICSALMYLVQNKVQNLIVSATFSAVISCANAALDCLITEVFPTNLRATGVAISMVAARLGGIIGNGKIPKTLTFLNVSLIMFISFSCHRNTPGYILPRSNVHCRYSVSWWWTHVSSSSEHNQKSTFLMKLFLISNQKQGKFTDFLSHFPPQYKPHTQPRTRTHTQKNPNFSASFPLTT